MSLLVKGLKMPDKCGCCKLFHAEYPMHCTAIKEHRTASAPYGMSRPDWCPLVEIKTPHGRLIDADALMQTYCRHEFSSDMGDAMEILDNYPTVIEAEKKDKI